MKRQPPQKQDHAIPAQDRLRLQLADCVKLMFMKFAATLFLTTAVLCACSSPLFPSAQDRYFAMHVKPVLEGSCLRCHSGPASPAGLDLSHRDGALKPLSPRTKRPFVIPGDPDDSLLVAAITRKGTHPKIMPRLEVSLTDDEIGGLSEWIEDGAYWPEGSAGQLQAVYNAENP